MHFYFEPSGNAKSDCAITDLSWMGKVPEDMPEEDNGWKLNRFLYYQEGWLATGNARGIVGVTYTSSHSKKNTDVPSRTNYNLRGHRSEVILVKWNEPYQKLATCDSSGIIFVWIKFEGRWSIELINDRNTPVTHFSWSHDGRMALICYQDGFVLVGSVAGQRYWSRSLNLDSVITAGVFTPEDEQVYFGTTAGLLIVMDIHGELLSEDALLEGTAVSSLVWSCPKFKMEESEDGTISGGPNLTPLLAVIFNTGLVHLLLSYDDVTPLTIKTGLQGLHAEWMNSGEILAVAGYVPTASSVSTAPYNNVVHFYSRQGALRCKIGLSCVQSPVSALTWGHNDKRFFVATGSHLSVARVTRRVASLTLLCRLGIKKEVQQESSLASLPLPRRLRNLVQGLYLQTIRSYIPVPSEMRDFVCRPPSGNRRLHCTIIKHDEDLMPTPGACYTLYLEYLGGLVPILKGKRTSKIKPEFVIYDPQAELGKIDILGKTVPAGQISDSSDSEYEDVCASPRLQRRRKMKRRLREKLVKDKEDLLYLDTLPENHRLVEVTSNIWGTKFKIHGITTSLPANLGQVTYKTSLLHLQPRQMSLIITEVRDDIPPRPDPTFNPNAFSEDEEDAYDKQVPPPSLHIDVPLIAPMTPKRTPSCYSHVELFSPVPGVPDEQSLFRRKPEHKTTHKLKMEKIKTDMLKSEKLKTEILKCEILKTEKLSGINGCSVKSEGQTFSRLNAPLASCSSTCRDVLLQSQMSPLRKAQGARNMLGMSSNLSREKNSISNQHSKNTYQRSEPRNSIMRSDQIIRYIDDESGDSEGRSFTPSPRHKYKARPRIRSKSVGHLLNLEEPSLKAPQATQFHQLTSIEAFLAFRRSLSLKDCKKRQVVAEVERPSLIDFGKSYSLDSSLVMLNCKSLLLTETTPPDSQSPSFADSSSSNVLLSSALHNSPNRVHVIRHPSHASHIYENINVYATAFSSATAPVRDPGSRRIKAKMLARPTSSQQRMARAAPPCVQAVTLTTSTTPRLQVGAGSSVLRTAETCFLRSLNPFATKEVILGERISLQKESSTYHTQPANPKRLPSPENGRISQINIAQTFSPTHSSKSSPTTPESCRKHRRRQSLSPIRKHLLNSPLLSRRRQRKLMVESSDDEPIHCSSDAEIVCSSNYHDLETFQKNQLRNKLRKARRKDHTACLSPSRNQPYINQSSRARQLFMYNKAPIWNENSQVYQLDFGGRVTQESAKNFQIEFREKQVMQFGRIDGNAYTLDFQHPFSAVQAFAVALANVTQRLK